MVVDKGSKGASNILNFNVGEGVKLALPNVFWTRLQSTFGTTFFVRENGEDVAIRRAIDTIDYCLRDELAYCTDVPMQFKDPSRAMYETKIPRRASSTGSPLGRRRSARAPTRSSAHERVIRRRLGVHQAPGRCPLRVYIRSALPSPRRVALALVDAPSRLLLSTEVRKCTMSTFR